MQLVVYLDGAIGADELGYGHDKVAQSNCSQKIDQRHSIYILMPIAGLNEVEYILRLRHVHSSWGSRARYQTPL